MCPTKILRLMLAAIGLACSQFIFAQGYPSKPIRVVVPFGTGSATDPLCRLISDRWSPRLGQPIIVDNRPGASGLIGADIVARSPADGYTMLCLGGGSMAAVLHKSLPWDFLKVFDPVGQFMKSAFFLVVSSETRATTAREFIDYAKANQGKINYYSIAASQQLAFALFASRVGIDAVHVAYSGAQARTDLATGRVHAGMDGPQQIQALIDTDKVRLLFYADSTRSPLYPNVPTAAEAGVDFAGPNSSGFWVPAGTPAAVVNRLNADLNEVVKMAEVQQRLIAGGYTPAYGPPEAFRSRVRSEHQIWNEAARVAHYVPE